MRRPSPPSGQSCLSLLPAMPKTVSSGCPKCQIGRRVRQAALAAGLGDGFSGNSGRVGKVLDLSNSGLGIPELMEAGRWKSAATPARYIKKMGAR